MYALLEVEVTLARKFIEDYKAKTGEQLSFTGYLIACLSRAVDEDKAVQAYRKGSKQLVKFDDVDVGFMVELKREEKRVLTGHVIRGANHTRASGKFTRRSVRYNPIWCHRMPKRFPGSVPPCCFRGPCPGYSRLDSV